MINDAYHVNDLANRYHVDYFVVCSFIVVLIISNYYSVHIDTLQVYDRRTQSTTNISWIRPWRLTFPRLVMSS